MRKKIVVDGKAVPIIEVVTKNEVKPMIEELRLEMLKTEGEILETINHILKRIIVLEKEVKKLKKLNENDGR